jgi:hypothetical protein
MVFDFERDIHGVYVVASVKRLTTASLYEPEIDAQTADLKKQIDIIAEKMKKEIRKNKESLFKK